MRILYQHPKIWTGTHEGLVTGVLVEDGIIVAVGDADQLADHTVSRTQRLPGALVIPGLHDSHIHSTAVAHDLVALDVRSARSLAEAQRRIGEFVAAMPAGVWLTGGSWDHNTWAEPRQPHRRDLDAVTGERPAVLDSHDAHTVWVNSAALAAAGIDRHTPDPYGGHIDRDADGEATGILRENAASLVWQVVPEDTAALPDQLANALNLMVSQGLTSITDLDGGGARAAFESLYAAGRLPLRVRKAMHQDTVDEALAAGRFTGDGDGWFGTGPMKLFSDGALGSHTCHMTQPFAGEPDNHGMPTLSTQEIIEVGRRAVGGGIAVCTHAIGDAAAASVLDAYETILNERSSAGRADREPATPHPVGRADREPATPHPVGRAGREPATPHPVGRAGREATVSRPRLRVEHAQHLRPADVSRFAELDVVASMQPTHCTADFELAQTLLAGHELASYAWRSLLDAGAVVAFGSDAPVEDFNPFLALHAAVTRQRVDGNPPDGFQPGERLTIDEALRAHSWGSAYADGDEDRKGCLAPGRYADFAALDTDVREVAVTDPVAIASTKVLQTVIGGETRWQSA